MALEDIKKFEQSFTSIDELKEGLFFHDEGKELINEVENVTLSNAKVLILNETNQFVSKKILSHDDLESNYLVYNPLIIDIENDCF